MMLKLAERVIMLKPSASIAAKKMVTELEAAGRKILDFTIGEPDLPTPPHIVEAAISAMRNGDTHYTASAGTPALREAVARKVAREKGLACKAENVVVGCGAKQLIYEAFATTVEAGVDVIVPAPYWVSYPDIVGLQGGRPVIATADAEDDFKLTPVALEAAITPATRWLVLNAPNNPTGAFYSREELAALADVLRRYPHVWIMTDEIYENLFYEGERSPSIVEVAPDLAERSLLISGVSKAYAMTGWRVGYAVGPKPLIDAMTKLLSQSTTCPSSISQAATVAALDGDQSCIEEATALYRKRRDRMVELLRQAPGLDVRAPSGAFYLYPCVAGLIGKTTPAGKVLKTDTDVALYLLEAANVAVVDGSAYGLSPYIRFSFATGMEIIEQGCANVVTACEALFANEPRQSATA